MASEAARREFFAQPFDIAFFGTHPRFDEIASKYRGAGHRIVEGHGGSRKSIALIGDGFPRAELDRARIAGTVVQLSSGGNSGTECLIEADGVSKSRQLRANSACDLLYPILAAANSLAYARWRECSAQQVAWQNA